MQSVSSDAVAQKFNTFLKFHTETVQALPSQWVQSSSGMYYCYKGNLSTYFGTNNYTLIGMYIGYWGGCSARNFQYFVEGDQFGFMTDNNGLTLSRVDMHFVYI